MHSENTEQSWSIHPGVFLLALALLSLLAYWPALDNGFISDDYVFLDRVDELSINLSYLYGIPPENFRTTTYLVFRLLKTLVGYQAFFFYLLTILLHAGNGWLLSRLLSRVGEQGQVGQLSGVLFVVFQNPHETIMWLGGMHELLLGFFLLSTLLLWVDQRHGWSLLAYCVALFSKESAPIVLLLIPLVEWWRLDRFELDRRYGWFLLPTGAAGVLFLSLSSSNSLLVGQFYDIGWGAAWVWIHSLHKLAFPWLYLVGLLAWRANAPSLKPLVAPLLWMGIALLPYIFLTYQNHVPSRHEYLASMAVATALAILIESSFQARARSLLVILFITVNVGYIALIKDPQFEQRAAPTRELVRELKQRDPAPLVVADFPLNPWIAHLTAPSVPGWTREMVLVDDFASCPECPVLRWVPEQSTYRLE